MVPAIRLEGFHRSTLTALECLVAPIYFRVWCDRKNERCQPSDSEGFTAWYGPHWCTLLLPYLKCRNIVDDVDELGHDGAPSVTAMITRGVMPPVSMHKLVWTDSCSTVINDYRDEENHWWDGSWASIKAWRKKTKKKKHDFVLFCFKILAFPIYTRLSVWRQKRLPKDSVIGTVEKPWRLSFNNLSFRVCWCVRVTCLR